MKRLIIYCEGYGEELVVRRLIRHALQPYGVHVENPIVAATKLEPVENRGGFVHWEIIRQDLKNLFSQKKDPNTRFTTLLDVYRMPDKVLRLAGFHEPVSTPVDIDQVQQAIEHDLEEPRFTAYLQRHELEALALADITALKTLWPNRSKQLAALQTSIQGFGSPEDVNHGSKTAPSKRLIQAVPEYETEKDVKAYWALAEVGIERARARCPRFDAWLKLWENWGLST